MYLCTFPKFFEPQLFLSQNVKVESGPWQVLSHFGTPEHFFKASKVEELKSFDVL